MRDKTLDMTFDSKDVAVIAELEAKTKAFRRELRAMLPAIERLAEADEASRDLSKDDVQLPYSNVRDDVNECLDLLHNIMESVEKVEVAAPVA